MESVSALLILYSNATYNMGEGCMKEGCPVKGVGYVMKNVIGFETFLDKLARFKLQSISYEDTYVTTEFLICQIFFYWLTCFLYI